MFRRLTIEDKQCVANLLGADDRPLDQLVELHSRIDYISGTRKTSRQEIPRCYQSMLAHSVGVVRGTQIRKLVNEKKQRVANLSGTDNLSVESIC